MTTFNQYVDSLVNSSENPDDNQLDEKMYWTYVTREGKRQKKWHTDKKNFRIQLDKKTGRPKEVFITPMERVRRKIGQRKAAIKRRAKQKNISARRHKSFYVRKNAGMRYNTGKSKKDIKHTSHTIDIDRDYLYPNMQESKLLLEMPHVEILPDVFWDFYSECDNNDGTWIMQLVSLVEDKEMHSYKEGMPNDNNNSPEAGTKNGVIKVSPGEIDQVLYAISTDILCMKMIRYAYVKLSEEDRAEFDAVMNNNGHENFLKNIQSKL